MVQLPIQSLSALPPNHDIRHLVRQILYLAAEAVDRQRTPLMMSQKIVQLLYKTPSQLGREVYVALLEQLCHSFEDVAKEAITWLLYADDEVGEFRRLYTLKLTLPPQRKYNVPVTVTLLRNGLLNITLLDQQLAKMLYTDPRPNLLNYVAALVRESLTCEPPVTTQAQFAYCIEILDQLVNSGKGNEEQVFPILKHSFNNPFKPLVLQDSWRISMVSEDLVLQPLLMVSFANRPPQKQNLCVRNCSHGFNNGSMSTNVHQPQRRTLFHSLLR
jgi:hypothetical protein